MEKKEFKLTDCDNCPFNVDVYTVSYKTIDNAESFCAYYQERIGGDAPEDHQLLIHDEDGDLMYDENDNVVIKDFPDFCEIREVVVKGEGF